VKRFKPRPRTGAVVGAVLAVVAIGAAAALANVVVYKNTFATKGAFKEIKKQGGKACDRDYNKKKKRFSAKVHGGPKTCAFKLPVQGDGSQPDHMVTVKGKISKNTKPSGVRKKAFVAVMVRVGSDHAYTLRVFPKTKRYQLIRKPDGGNFPSNGSSNRIKGIGKANQLRLQAFGSSIKASVNGTKLATVNDGNAGQVDGRAIEFALGNRGHSGKPTLGSFDSLQVAVPNP
jgi:hypothetical protein